MAKTTTMDIYVKDEIVFSYVREEGDFNRDDIVVRICCLDTKCIFHETNRDTNEYKELARELRRNIAVVV